MSENGNHPLRPTTEWCRIKALRKWTGWSKEFIRYLEASGKLKPHRFRRDPKDDPPWRPKRKGKLGQRYYLVAAVDKIIVTK